MVGGRNDPSALGYSNLDSNTAERLKWNQEQGPTPMGGLGHNSFLPPIAKQSDPQTVNMMMSKMNMQIM